MSSLDLLFWLLIALLAAVALAIEAGLVNRHRNLLLSSVATAFASVIFIMFWIEDHSSLNLGPRPGPLQSKGGGDKGGFQIQSKGGKKGELPPMEEPPAEEEEEEPEDAAEEAPEYSKAPFNDCPECPAMVIVPAGIVSIGAPENEPGRQPQERGGATVRIAAPFAVSRFEIKRDEFEMFLSQSKHPVSDNCQGPATRRAKQDWMSPGFSQTGSHPVVCISWIDAQAYVEWLSRKSRRNYRLLSEAEWEYMARGRSVGAFWTGPVLTSQHANFANNRFGTVAAGSTATNAFGLQEVHGNAWELVADCWTDPPAPVPQDASAIGSPRCGQRVIKGGGWNSSWHQARIAARASIAEDASFNNVGLRIARDVDDRDKAKQLPRKPSPKTAEKAAKGEKGTSATK